MYSLSGNGGMRSTTMCLNGKPLTMGENDELPIMEGVNVSGEVELKPGTCTFIVI